MWLVKFLTGCGKVSFKMLCIGLICWKTLKEILFFLFYQMVLNDF